LKEAPNGEDYLKSLRNRGRLQEAAELERRYVPSRFDLAGDGSFKWGGNEEGTRQFTTKTGNEGTMGRVRAEREDARGSAQEAQTPDPVRVRAVPGSMAMPGSKRVGLFPEGHPDNVCDQIPMPWHVFVARQRE